MLKPSPTTRRRASVAFVIFAIALALCAPQPSRAGTIQYSLFIGTPLNDQTYRNNSHVDYYTIVHTKNFSKFKYLIVPAPSCTNFLFPEFVKLATALEASNKSGMKLVFYSRPVGSDGWEAYSFASPGCSTNAPPASNPTALSYYQTLMATTRTTIPAVDLEGLHYPTGLDVGAGILNYLTDLTGIWPAAQAPWVANTAYPEKFMSATGQYFTFSGAGQITGNTTLPPSLIAQLGQVIWMDFHTMYAEITPSPRAFIDQRLQQVAAISGAQTSIQIGLTCLNGKVTLKGVSDQQTMSTAVAEGETVLMDAVTEAGISNFNVYTALSNLESPQWQSFYSFMHTNSANFPTTPNVAFKPANAAGIAYGDACLQE